MFLFRTDRGLAFVDRPGGDSTTADARRPAPGGSTQLLFSPGRIDPADAGVERRSRKPLAGEFTYHGHHLFVIANHFNSKGGDDPLFGRFQPPVRSSARRSGTSRRTLVHDFVAQILRGRPERERRRARRPERLRVLATTVHDPRGGRACTT